MPKGYKIKVKDSGARKFWRKITRKPEILRVGVLKNPEVKHPNAEVSVGQIAIWNEYGTMSAPARSFVRDWATINEQKFSKQLAAVARAVHLKDKDEKQELSKKGKTYANSMKKRIRAGIPPKNAPATLARKKGETPLIDTKTLINSITFTVEQ